MDGAMENLYRKIAAIGRRFRAERVVLFGSRARGDNRSRSDIDIAVFGVSPDDLPAFREQLDELPTLLEFDLVFVTEQTNPKLVANIERDGVILMDKMQEKYEILIFLPQRLILWKNAVLCRQSAAPRLRDLFLHLMHLFGKRIISRLFLLGTVQISQQ